MKKFGILSYLVCTVVIVGCGYNQVQAQGVAYEMWNAAQSGNTEKLRLLVGSGANLNADYNGITPLSAAIRGGKIEAVKLLLASGADPNKLDKLSGNTPLMDALNSPMMKDKLGVVRVLLAGGADVDVKNDRGESAIDMALKQNQSSVAKLMTEHKKKLEQSTGSPK